MSSKLTWLVIGAIASPILLFFGEIALLAIGLVTVGIVGSAFFEELKAIENGDSHD